MFLSIVSIEKRNGSDFKSIYGEGFGCFCSAAVFSVFVVSVIVFNVIIGLSVDSSIIVITKIIGSFCILNDMSIFGF